MLKVEENKESKEFCLKCKRVDLELNLRICNECEEELTKLIFVDERIRVELHKTKGDNCIYGDMSRKTSLDIGKRHFGFIIHGSVSFFEQYEIEVNLPEFSERALRLQVLKEKEIELENMKRDLLC